MCKLNKIVILLTMVLLIAVFSCGCSTHDPDDAEQPQHHWKTVNAVITDIDKQHWSAGIHNYYDVNITLYNEEYDVEGVIYRASDGMSDFGWWGCATGNTIKVQMDYWIMESTGEVVRKEITDAFLY